MRGLTVKFYAGRLEISDEHNKKLALKSSDTAAELQCILVVIKKVEAVLYFLSHHIRNQIWQFVMLVVVTSTPLVSQGLAQQEVCGWLPVSASRLIVSGRNTLLRCISSSIIDSPNYSQQVRIL